MAKIKKRKQKQTKFQLYYTWIRELKNFKFSARWKIAHAIIRGQTPKELYFLFILLIIVVNILFFMQLGAVFHDFMLKMIN